MSLLLISGRNTGYIALPETKKTTNLLVCIHAYSKARVDNEGVKGYMPKHKCTYACRQRLKMVSTDIFCVWTDPMHCCVFLTRFLMTLMTTVYLFTTSFESVVQLSLFTDPLLRHEVQTLPNFYQCVCSKH